MPHFSLGVPSFSPREDKKRETSAAPAGHTNIKTTGQKKNKKRGRVRRGMLSASKFKRKMENILKSPRIYIRQSHKALTYCYLILLLWKDLLWCCSQKTICVLTADTRWTKKKYITHCFMTIFNSSKWASGLQRCCTCCQPATLKCNKGTFSHLLTREMQINH